jgi:hypothetical protein
MFAFQLVVRDREWVAVFGRALRSQEAFDNRLVS